MDPNNQTQTNPQAPEPNANPQPPGNSYGQSQPGSNQPQAGQPTTSAQSVPPVNPQPPQPAQPQPQPQQPPSPQPPQPQPAQPAQQVPAPQPQQPQPALASQPVQQPAAAQATPPAASSSDYYADGKKPGITLGILSLIFSLIPIVGIVLGVISIIKGAGKNSKLLILGIAGILLSIIMAFFFAIILYSETEANERADQFISYISAEDYDPAFEMLAPQFQEELTMEGFLDFMEHEIFDEFDSSCTFTGSESRAEEFGFNTVSLQGSTQCSNTGTSYQSEFKFVDLDDQLLIYSFSFSAFTQPL